METKTEKLLKARGILDKNGNLTSKNIGNIIEYFKSQSEFKDQIDFEFIDLNESKQRFENILSRPIAIERNGGIEEVYRKLKRSVINDLKFELEKVEEENKIYLFLIKNDGHFFPIIRYNEKTILFDTSYTKDEKLAKRPEDRTNENIVTELFNENSEGLFNTKNLYCNQFQLQYDMHNCQYFSLFIIRSFILNSTSLIEEITKNTENVNIKHSQYKIPTIFQSIKELPPELYCMCQSLSNIKKIEEKRQQEGKKTLADTIETNSNKTYLQILEQGKVWNEDENKYQNKSIEKFKEKVFKTLKNLNQKITSLSID